MLKPGALFLALSILLHAQIPVADMRAKITAGGGPGGKCSIEVDVDEVAEIQIFGDTGRMQTIGGQPATWRRMDCNTALPGSPAGFRFSGVDGRGRQILVRDPTDGLGVAVIRIEDSQRGRENYTFDITWSNGGPVQAPNNANSTTSNNGGFGSGNSNGAAGQSGQSTGVADFAYAVHGCQTAIVNRAVQNGFTNVVVWSANLQDNPGNNDVLTGNATAAPTRGGNVARVQYSCTVDAATGRVMDLQVR